MVEVVRFDDALVALADSKKTHLLLGNGFSMALDPDIFSYGSLYEQADFEGAAHLPDLFEALGTRDFELVIRHLLNAAQVVRVYRPKLVRLASRLEEDANIVKRALVAAVAGHHPARPYDIAPERYVACRQFLSRFDHIFTLNYDITLYWALMNEDVDELDITPDDGFRHPEDDPDLPWVSWQQSHSATVHYLHGALHLFDHETEIIKYTWSKTDLPLIDQIRTSLDESKYPLFVAEGSSASKKRSILHNAYLHKALRSFESCCNPKSNSMLIYGHSIDENDSHVLRCISRGGLGCLAVGLYGDPTSAWNLGVIERTEYLVGLREHLRGDRFPLDLVYFDSSTARVWG